jgi:hypothetical protein
MIISTITPVYYPNWIGNRQVYVGTGNGPSSYNQTTGDPLSVAFTPFFIDSVMGPAVTVDGKYIAVPVPIATGKGATWTLFWFNFIPSVGGTPAWTAVASGANISTETIQLGVIGGP